MLFMLRGRKNGSSCRRTLLTESTVRVPASQKVPARSGDHTLPTAGRLPVTCLSSLYQLTCVRFLCFSVKVEHVEVIQAAPGTGCGLSRKERKQMKKSV